MSFQYPEVNEQELEICHAFEEWLELRDDAIKSLPNIIKYLRLALIARKAKIKHRRLLKEYIASYKNNMEDNC